MNYITPRRILKGILNPQLGLKYLTFMLSGGKLTLTCGATVSGFLDFNEYLGTLANQPNAQELSLYHLVPEQNAVFLDVGANIGVFSLSMLSRRPNTEVHCFEPAPVNVDRLSANIKQNGYNTTIHRVALSSPQAPEVMSFFADESSPSTMHFAEDDHSCTIQVEVSTVDKFCKTHQIETVDLLKIDVEGYEVDVLLGAQHALQESIIKNILIEICPCNLQRSGFSIDELWNTWGNVNYIAYSLPAQWGDKLKPVSLAECKSFKCENILLKPTS